MSIADSNQETCDHRSGYPHAWDVLEPRDVVLGRSQHVRRLLPAKARRMVGAWCFLDHFGPDDVATTGGMFVPPHPHTGLQTVTWLFEGHARHLDSLGSDQLICPGELNVMTSGRGISHAEVTPDNAPARLHGVQLWVALPDEVRNVTAPAFDHLRDLPTLVGQGAELRIFVGQAGQAQSVAPVFSPLFGAQLTLSAGAHFSVPVRPDFEYAALAVDADVRLDTTASNTGSPFAGSSSTGSSSTGELNAGELNAGGLNAGGLNAGSSGSGTLATHHCAYVGAGLESLTLRAGDHPATVLVLGGEPFTEELVMWWNFIGRTHEEVVAAREEWNGRGHEDTSGRFGIVENFTGKRLLAPELPNVRLRPRGRSGQAGESS